jgi:signal transduction histidine kinase
LIINEVGLAHPASALITRELMSQLAARPDYQVEFYIESLDSVLLTDEASQEKAESLLVEHYKNYRLDVIVVMGPAAIKFLSRVSSTFHPEVPVVICGSSEAQAGYPRLGSSFTGTWLKFDPAKTVDTALKLLPGTEHVVIVGGSSAFDKTVEAYIKASLNSYTAVVDLTYLTDLEMSSLLDRLRHLPSHTIVLYTSFFSDVAGNRFVNATTALPLVSKASNAPVFGMSDTYLGRGIVGGFVASFAEQGKIVARIISDLFAGKEAKDIPVLTASSSYVFDWTQLQRWHLNENNLPPGSVILNREPSLWEQAKWILLTGLLVILALGSMTAYLLYERKLLTRTRGEQTRLSGMLINAQEDERRRLASEIHDDFSQRLAILSLGLETAAELVPADPEKANRQLQELLNSAGELGADLHTLSHRLHSSTLERLGLVTGVKAFCKEFTAQKGIQVVFSHQNVPRSVPPETALCLFRVVQEALRNVKKHSGASEAQVGLEQLNGYLHLSISDDGAGFSPKDLARKHGIGILSMKERAQLIGARFEIQSERQRGTQVDIWAPVAKQACPKADGVAAQSAVSGA